jgi:hypothetical protein
MCIEYAPLTHRHLLDVQTPIPFPKAVWKLWEGTYKLLCPGFNSKLGCFATQHSKCIAHIQPLLGLYVVQVFCLTCSSADLAERISWFLDDLWPTLKNFFSALKCNKLVCFWPWQALLQAHPLSQQIPQRLESNRTFFSTKCILVYFIHYRSSNMTKNCCQMLLKP